MAPKTLDKNHKDINKDVHDLLLTEDEEVGRAHRPEDIVDSRQRGGPFWTPPLIVTAVVLVLAAIGLGIIYASPNLREQFQAMMSGELGKYKDELRKAREDRIREVENLSANRYGALTLFYSPRDARVTITESKYKLDCSAATDEDALIQCLRKKIDYNQKPEVRTIDNPSLHLKEREVVEQLPLNDIPIQESSEDRKQVYRYELAVVIERDGYFPRMFHIVGDKDRPPLNAKDTEVLYWDQKGPGVFMVDFRGADLFPKPETAKENYKKASLDITCVNREVEAKRKEGKKISDDTINGLNLEIINRHGFKTFEEWDMIDKELQKDEAFQKALKVELEKHVCK